MDKITLPKEFLIIPLDSVSMYSNISSNLIRGTTDNLWKEIEPRNFIARVDLNIGLKVCLQSSWFQLDDKFHP